MTGALHAAAERIAKVGRLPRPDPKDRLAIEKVVAKLSVGDEGSMQATEPWEDFLHRIGAIGDGIHFAGLRRRDLSRFVRDLWSDPRCSIFAMPALAAAAAMDSQSVDRAMVKGYLYHFPRMHMAFDALRAAAGQAASRRDWDWRQRGKNWDLWNPNSVPLKLAKALLGENGPEALRDAGLEGDLANGKLVHEAVISACFEAAKAHNNVAISRGAALISLFNHFEIVGQNPLLAYGLLAPWEAHNAPEAYRRDIGRLLVEKLGDPRFQSGKWLDAVKECRDRYSLDLEPMVTTLRRWLTEATFREFFNVVTYTTDNLDQWREREKFWLGYLEASLVNDAWFALGTRAEQLVRSKEDLGETSFARITGERQYADPGHSSLIMAIGDLRIAEWSHNGACRFWRASDRTAPAMYKAQYFGYQLRAMNGGPGFEYISHQSSWQKVFTRKIYEETGCEHPVHGQGYRSLYR